MRRALDRGFFRVEGPLGLFEQVEKSVFVLGKDVQPVQLLLQFIRLRAVLLGLCEESFQALLVLGLQATRVRQLKAKRLFFPFLVCHFHGLLHLR